MLQKFHIEGVATTTEDTSSVNHVVVRRNNNPNILVYLDFIQTKAIRIKKVKDFKRKPTLRKDLNLQIKKNVSSAVKRVTGLTNAQIKRKILDFLPCFQKTWIQPGGIYLGVQQETTLKVKSSSYQKKEIPVIPTLLR